MKRVAALLAVLLCLGGAGTIGTAQGAVDEATRSVARAAKIPALKVPKLGIGGAPIVPVGVDAQGHLAVGPSVTAVYTWKDGARPGQPGSAVLAGHTWSAGAGVFDNLGNMVPKDKIQVGRATFSVTRVQRVRSMSRRQVAELFSDRGRSRVVLITCGDRSDATGVYASRILVFATKV